MEKTYRYRPLQFFFFANLFTWLVWFAAAFLSHRQDPQSKMAITILMAAGLFGPFATSLWMIFRSGSDELRRNYLDRLLNLRLIRPASIPAIFLIMPATVLVSVLISHILMGQSLDQLKIDKAPFAAGLIPIPVLMFGAALVEELGWKGYGVDSLRGKRSFLAVSIIYGALWGLWHLPTFFIQGYYQNIIFRQNPLYALNFMVSIVAAAVIINWLWHMNKGSILTAALFHAVTNCQGLLQMGQAAKCIQTLVLIIVAATIVIADRKRFLQPFPPRIGDFGRIFPR